MYRNTETGRGKFCFPTPPTSPLGFDDEDDYKKRYIQWS